MNNHVKIALNYADKSISPNHKHGACCVLNGRVISAGYNYPDDPHHIKVD